MKTMPLPARSLFACAALILASVAAPVTAAPAVLAHRGGPFMMPENTIPAFDNAIRLGADILEFDMNLTADDRLVIHHDSSVDPATCVADAGSGLTPGPIREMTLAETQKFDCGTKHPAAFPNQATLPGTRMPTLEAFLDRYAGRNVILFGETKMPAKPAGRAIDPVRFAAQIAVLVEKHKAVDQFILQSADYRTIDAMHNINPRIRTCLLWARLYKPHYLELARQHHATCLVLSATDVADDKQIPQLQAAGISVFGNISDKESEWREYLRLGVDALGTNDPAGLIAFLKSVGARK